MIGYIKEQPCHEKNNHHKAPINDLDHKFDKDICSLQCKIAKHISDADVHVTKENKNNWNSKVDQSQINTINNNINSISNEILDFKNEIGDVDNIVKKDNIIDFATKEYVSSYISSFINTKDFATKEYVQQYVNKHIDKTNYYTKQQINTLFDSNIKDYTISSIGYENGVLTISQNGVENTKSVSIKDSASQQITQDEFDDMLKSSNAIHTLICNNKRYNPVVADCDISSYFGSNISENGYSIQASEISYNYIKSDDKYNITFTSVFKLLKNSNGYSEYLSLSDYYLKYAYESNDFSTSGITYDNLTNSATINFTGSTLNSSIVVQIYAYQKGTDSILAQFLIPISASGKDGETSQTISGSPLRIKGLYVAGKKYYDGKHADNESDGVFYQDVVLYNNIYYACVNTEAGEENNWAISPDSASYFSAFSLTSDQMADLLIANKAFIKELSSNEVVVIDDDSIVAGMTSGKSIDSNSLLNGKVKNKGNVRIWAGKPLSTGDITTAPLTITDSGQLTINGKNKSSSINFDSNSLFPELTIQSNAGYVDGDYETPSTDSKSSISLNLTSDPDTLSIEPEIILRSGVTNSSTIDAGGYAAVLNPIRGITFGHGAFNNSFGLTSSQVFGENWSFSDTNITSQILNIYPLVSGNLYVKLGDKNNKLPTEDPKEYGVLYTDSSGNLKVSLG